MKSVDISKLTVYGDFLARPVSPLFQLGVYVHLGNKKLIINTTEEGSVNFEFPLSNYLFMDPLEKIVVEKKVDEILVDKVLEQIRDIRPLLALLRKLSQEKKIKIKLVFDSNIKNQKKRRYWTSNDNIKNLIFLTGFEISEMSTEVRSYYVYSSKKQYSQFLKKINFVQDDFKYLIATTEHSDYRITGGIGSYVKECEKLYGKDSNMLIIDNNKTLDQELISDKKWFSAQALIGADRVNCIDNSNYDMISGVVYESVQQILFFYPKLRVVESQEALLDRSICAKKANLLPHNLLLVTVCHGSSFHLARAKKDMLELEQIHIAYREKRTVEDSDVTVFPTSFLKESYERVGIEKLDRKNKIVRRLPFDLARIPEGRPLNDFKKLIYIGKTSSTKGFDIFLKTLIMLKEKNSVLAEKIEEINCIVTSTEINERNIRELFDQCRSIYKINIISLNREDLMVLLAEGSEDSLCLVTYPGDNHPTVILELMATGHDFLALDCGGTPELIPSKYHDSYIVKNDVKILCKRIISSLSNITERKNLIKELSSNYIKEQSSINKEYKTSFFERYCLDKPKLNKQPTIDVCVLDVENEKKYRETVNSIKAQTYKKINIILNNKVNPENYKLRLSAGDVIDSDCIYQIASLLQTSPSSAVMMNETLPTYENYAYKNTEEFSPVNPQLGNVFLQEKYKRRVVALLKEKDVIHELEHYSDWEIIINMSSRAKKISIYPENLVVLGRNDEDIIWDHQVLQDRSNQLMKRISKFDTYIMYAQLKRLDDLYFGSRLYNHLEDIYVKRDDPTVLVGVGPATVKLIGAYKKYMPRLIHRFIITSLKKTYKIFRKLKNF